MSNEYNGFIKRLYLEGNTVDRGLLIGVDGGGTHTRAIAVRPDGSIAAAAAGSGMNYHNIGLAAARKNLQAIVDELLARCGASSYARLTVGLSALDSAADDETRARFAGDLFDAEKLDLESDAYTALMGVTLGGPGAITICGTGSMLLMLDENGVQHVSGGWGHALGDVGSSYTMAVEGLRAAINAWEGTGAATKLCEEALQFYHISAPRALIDKVYSPSVEPGRLAQFARVVLSLALEDMVAYDIVRGNMTRLARQTVALLKGHEGISRIGVYGGVFQHNPWALSCYAEEIRKSRPCASISLPEYPPEAGAVIHAFIREKALTDEVLRNLRAGAPKEPMEA